MVTKKTNEKLSFLGNNSKDTKSKSLREKYQVIACENFTVETSNKILIANVVFWRGSPTVGAYKDANNK